jgi:hypothetical protein
MIQTKVGAIAFVTENASSNYGSTFAYQSEDNFVKRFYSGFTKKMRVTSVQDYIERRSNETHTFYFEGLLAMIIINVNVNFFSIGRRGK